MYRKLLNKRFFQDNPCEESSVQRFVYSYLSYDGIEQAANEILLEHMALEPERLEKIGTEKAMIEVQDDPEILLQLLRKKIDTLNQTTLLDKVLEHELDILPKVADKLIRSDHDTFIENAVRLLAKSEVDYSSILQERFDEIRSPYVKSLVCIIMGFRSDEVIIPWMMAQFELFKRLYPHDSFDQGALLELYELNARFYG